MEIGKKLKYVRQSKGMTLEETSLITDVSIAMLGQIERGQSSPTVNTLWKIATGLKMPFSYFLQDNKTQYTIVDFKEDFISEENGMMRAYTIFPFDPVRNYEVFTIEFDAGCVHNSPPHNGGVEESVFVVKGKLDMLLDGKKVSLNEKQAIRFQSDIPHSYINSGEELCCVYNMIFYQN